MSKLGLQAITLALAEASHIMVTAAPVKVRRLRHHFRPFPTQVQALHHPARAACCDLRGAHAYRVLIGAWNPMLWPIRGCRAAILCCDARPSTAHCVSAAGSNGLAISPPWGSTATRTGRRWTRPRRSTRALSVATAGCGSLSLSLSLSLTHLLTESLTSVPFADIFGCNFEHELARNPAFDGAFDVSEGNPA